MEKETNLILGLDEIGTGSLAGPAFFVGVLASADWKLSCLRDSKKLSSQKRESAYQEILNSGVSYHIKQYSAQEIDQIRLAGVFAKAFKGIIEEFNRLGYFPARIVIDGKNRYGTNAEAIIKADDSIPTVSAASIIGKVSRDALMIKLGEQYPNYGFDKHKGYGSKEHRAAIDKFGPCEIHRKSFLKCTT